MARSGARKVTGYGDGCKATAVKPSNLPGVLTQEVASALDIHPFMLSPWRKEVRDGVVMAKSAKLDVETKAEVKKLRDVERLQDPGRGARTPRNSHPVCCRSKTEIFEFIEATRTEYQAALICRLYGVTARRLLCLARTGG